MKFITITEKVPESYLICARGLGIVRRRAGLSIKEVAARLEMSILDYALVENGERRFESEAVYDQAMELIKAPRTPTEPQ